ncbi:MAG: hypothetical protein OXC40_03955 [Proteobacteria bacterium]|nr:hypothetical protein [Pseudomonadota bacterium]
MPFIYRRYPFLSHVLVSLSVLMIGAPSAFSTDNSSLANGSMKSLLNYVEIADDYLSYIDESFARAEIHFVSNASSSTDSESVLYLVLKDKDDETLSSYYLGHCQLTSFADLALASVTDTTEVVCSTRQATRLAISRISSDPPELFSGGPVPILSGCESYSYYSKRDVRPQIEISKHSFQLFVEDNLAIAASFFRERIIPEDTHLSLPLTTMCHINR